MISTVGVIGAGPTGRAVAALAAAAGYRTILEAVSQEFLGDAIADIRDNILEPQQRDNAIANLSTSRSVEDVCREADLLIESAQEELEVKLEIFTLFDKFAKPAAILASTSETIPITDLSEITFRGENCLGLRFTNPRQRSGPLEIIRTAETSDATVAACVEVGKRMGREPQVSKI
jgi:3-hydroxyacyl-CoA dehydrogenase